MMKNKLRQKLISNQAIIDTCVAELNYLLACAPDMVSIIKEVNNRKQKLQKQNKLIYNLLNTTNNVSTH